MNDLVFNILKDRASRNGPTLLGFLAAGWGTMIFIAAASEKSILVSAAVAAYLMQAAEIDRSTAANRVYLQLPIGAKSLIQARLLAALAIAGGIYLPLAMFTVLDFSFNGSTAYGLIASTLGTISTAILIHSASIWLRHGSRGLARRGTSLPPFLRGTVRIAVLITANIGIYFAAFYVLSACGAPGFITAALLVASAWGTWQWNWNYLPERRLFEFDEALTTAPNEHLARPKVFDYSIIPPKRAVFVHFASAPLGAALVIVGSVAGYLIVGGLFGKDSTDSSSGFFAGVGGMWFMSAAESNQSLIASFRALRSLPVRARRLTGYACFSSLLFPAISSLAIAYMDWKNGAAPQAESLIVLGLALFGANMVFLAFYTGWQLRAGVYAGLADLLIYAAILTYFRITSDPTRPELMDCFLAFSVLSSAGGIILLNHILKTSQQAYRHIHMKKGYELDWD